MLPSDKIVHAAVGNPLSKPHLWNLREDDDPLPSIVPLDRPYRYNAALHRHRRPRSRRCCLPLFIQEPSGAREGMHQAALPAATWAKHKTVDRSPLRCGRCGQWILRLGGVHPHLVMAVRNSSWYPGSLQTSSILFSHTWQTSLTAYLASCVHTWTAAPGLRNRRGLRNPCTACGQLMSVDPARERWMCEKEWGCNMYKFE